MASLLCSFEVVPAQRSKLLIFLDLIHSIVKSVSRGVEGVLGARSLTHGLDLNVSSYTFHAGLVVHSLLMVADAPGDLLVRSARCGASLACSSGSSLDSTKQITKKQASSEPTRKRMDAVRVKKRLKEKLGQCLFAREEDSFAARFLSY
ncbi:hypothetical protein GW17_00025114 [Ensete ventricosum]|nr:hypothetical protein GW17_00025114 [Ensete ventricosum]RZS11728.1 hypothetical protein BHM03_00043089 [Ensete ventricosum]